jgi:hypothetical protein
MSNLIVCHLRALRVYEHYRLDGKGIAEIARGLLKQ